MEARTMLTYDVAQLSRPIQSEIKENFCGDMTLVIENETNLFLAIFDGAGHGIRAHQIADKAIDFIKSQQHKPLTNIILNLDEYLRGSRGGVVVLCKIDKATGNCVYSGIGNIGIRLFSVKSQLFILRSGILGYEIAPPKQNQITLKPNDILLLYSDGIKSHLELTDIPYLENDAATLSRIIIDYHSKSLDDASVIVAKVDND